MLRYILARALTLVQVTIDDIQDFKMLTFLKKYYLNVQRGSNKFKILFIYYWFYFLFFEGTNSNLKKLFLIYKATKDYKTMNMFIEIRIYYVQRVFE